MWNIIRDDSTNEVKMITMTVGDTPSFKINCNVKSNNDEIEPYIPEDEDEFIFACKRNKNDEDYLFKIDIPNDTMVVQFKEEHTKGLPLGKYIWEISLNKPSIEYHCTFIAEKILKLTTEVY